MTRPAAPAAQRPEQVGLVVGVDVQLVAGGGHDVERADVARGEALAAREPAEPAAERVARDADAGRHAVQAGEAVLAGRRHHRPPRRAGLDLRGPRAGVDLHAGQPRRAQQDRAGEVAEHRRAVPGRLRGDAQAVRRRVAHRRGEVGGRAPRARRAPGADRPRGSTPGARRPIPRRRARPRRRRACCEGCPDPSSTQPSQPGLRPASPHRGARARRRGRRRRPRRRARPRPAAGPRRPGRRRRRR